MYVSKNGNRKLEIFSFSLWLLNLQNNEGKTEKFVNICNGTLRYGKYIERHFK